MLQDSNALTDLVTLEEVFKALNHWRNNKSDYPGAGIPDKLWLMIFKLEGDLYSSTALRRIFSLSSTQYKIKKEQLCALPNAQASKRPPEKSDTNNGIDNSANFCEALVIPNEADLVAPLTEKVKSNQQALSKLKSTNNSPKHYLDGTTIIVECIRPDGERLKIHTTNQNLEVVMKNFYQQGAVHD